MPCYNLTRNGYILDTQSGIAYREIVVSNPSEPYDFEGVEGTKLRYERVARSEATFRIEYKQTDVFHCKTAGEMADLLLERDGVPTGDTEARDWYHRVARIHMYPSLANRPHQQ